VIGSGGLKNGVDVAKALALGADLAGLAYQFLEAATESPEKVVERIERIVQELKITMFCIGAKTITELKRTGLERRSKT
jgi:isopentenyl-diphosphate delta-isomerase